jgi:hypothetical protein
MRSSLCLGYCERDVQEIIAENGPDFWDVYCALCGQKVKPVNVNKDGGWIPKSHDVHPNTPNAKLN